MSNEESIRNVICENLNRLLYQKQLTQKELAERMGVSASTVNDWVKGKKIPRMDKVDKLCAIFGVSREGILCNNSSQSNPAAAPQQPPADGLPALSPREERDIERDLEDMMHSVAQADYKAPGDEEDAEALKAALRVAMIQAKRTAKKKYTPRKYRKDK